MSALTSILIGLIALLGIPSGIILALIAPEELKAGKVYFKTMSALIFILMSFLLIYYFFAQQQYLFLTLFVIVAVIFFVLKLRYDFFWLDWLNTLFFLSFYFLLALFFKSEMVYQLLLASLLFLSGLPTGSLLKMNFQRKNLTQKKRKE